MADHTNAISDQLIELSGHDLLKERCGPTWASAFTTTSFDYDYIPNLFLDHSFDGTMLTSTILTTIETMPSLAGFTNADNEAAPTKTTRFVQPSHTACMRSAKTPPQPTDSSSIPISARFHPPPRSAKKIHYKERKPQKKQQPINYNKGTKRIKFLERNRQAASKCRQNNKERIHKLEETKYDLEMCHSDLQTEYDSLSRDVIELKNLLISHAYCNDSNIDSWIGGEARRFCQSL